MQKGMNKDVSPVLKGIAMNNLHEHARKSGLVRPSYPVPRVTKSIPPSAAFSVS